MSGDREDADAHLHACFDILTQARDQFYPVDSYLIDLTLVAPTTMGASLRTELASDTPLNVLLSGETLERMANEQPETLAALKEALARGTVCLVGGEYSELELPLLPMEEVLAQLALGRATYLKHLGAAPVIFGRRRFGLCPQLPQVLSRLGFQAALHMTMDDGRFPVGQQAKCRWEGHDSSTIDCLAKAPLDASQSGSFINLSHRLGDTMDHDHVATLVFARWPGQSSDWYEDMRRIAARGPALGKFIKLDDYFANTDTPDRLIRFEADEYQSPYLRQAVAASEADPISRFVQKYAARMRQDALSTIEQLTQLVRPQVVSQIADSAAKNESLAQAVQNFSAAASGRETSAAAPSDVSVGSVVVNPLGSRTRLGMELPHWPNLPELADPVRAVGQTSETSSAGSRKQAVVDVPACGFVFVAPAKTNQRMKASKEPAMAEGTVLQNDHLEVLINPHTGSIHGVREHGKRGNLLSQQIAFRASSVRPRGVVGEFVPPEDPYSVMAVDSIEATASTSAMGELVSRGRLLDRSGKRLAGFTQKLQLWRGSRVIQVELTLEPDTPAGSDPWDSYYAVRFAWGESDAHLWRSTGATCHPNVVKRFEAPLFVDLRCEAARLTLLTAGLPYHQRTGDRILDTLLIVRGESARTFRYGIGVNVGSPLPAALEFLLPSEELLVPVSTAPATNSAWLWHLDTRQVSITWMEAIVEAGCTVGCRLRILESTGKPGHAVLSCFRPLVEARQTDYVGEKLCELRLAEGAVQLDFAAYEWVQLEARWEQA
jgi:alpha-mannosidase